MSFKKKCAGIAAAGALVVGFGLAASPAMADDLDLEITAGDLEWTLDGGGVDFGAVDYSLATQTKTGSAGFDLADMTASGDGWVATMQAAGGANAMTNGTGGSISAQDLYYLPASSAIESDPGAEGGSMTGVTKGSLGNLFITRTIFTASQGNGGGAYNGTVNLQAQLAAGQAPGTYSGTLNVTINPQP